MAGSLTNISSLDASNYSSPATTRIADNTPLGLFSKYVKPLNAIANMILQASTGGVL